MNKNQPQVIRLCTSAVFVLLLSLNTAWCQKQSGLTAANADSKISKKSRLAGDSPFVVVLGTAQDAGFPQAGCLKDCCKEAWGDPKVRRFPTSVAIVDPKTKQRWLLDCTWQLPDQLQMLNSKLARKDSPGIDGIFLTHGHIGHYTGLMHLGREVMGAKDVPVFAMPRMKTFLEKNGPWSLLVKLKNIKIKSMKANQKIKLNQQISITPIMVPHRGEYTETVGFVVETTGKSVLFLPDIDKWSRWETKIEKVLESVDIAFLDATFFANGEIPGRDMSQIPHPFVEESLLRFRSLDATERNKIHFIHLNHTNPALNPNGKAADQIRRAGMNLAVQGKVYSLKKSR